MSDDTSSSVLIGRRLAAARRKAGLSQSELGKVIGVSGPRISHFESGHSIPKSEHRVPLAEAVQMNVSRLFSPLPDSPRGAGIRNIARPNPIKANTTRTQANTTQVMKLLQGMDQAKLNLALAMIRTLNRVK